MGRSEPIMVKVFMNSVEAEIFELEECLRQADLAPDPAFFQKYFDDGLVLMADGDICSHSPKAYIVDRHKPGRALQFDRVEIADLKIMEQGSTVVVTGFSSYQGPSGNFSINFMRIWVKKPEGWKVVAGAITHLDEARAVESSRRVTAEISLH
jgi:ketosteroid isomerase-like protein